jgi:hypothetical protein
MAEKEIKYRITVEVFSRRITETPLNTSMDRLLGWNSECSAATVLHALDRVHEVVNSISGYFRPPSAEDLKALGDLKENAKK